MLKIPVAPHVLNFDVGALKLFVIRELKLGMSGIAYLVSQSHGPVVSWSHSPKHRCNQIAVAKRAEYAPTKEKKL